MAFWILLPSQGVHLHDVHVHSNIRKTKNIYLVKHIEVVVLEAKVKIQILDAHPQKIWISQNLDSISLPEAAMTSAVSLCDFAITADANALESFILLMALWTPSLKNLVEIPRSPDMSYIKTLCNMATTIWLAPESFEYRNAISILLMKLFFFLAEWFLSSSQIEKKIMKI